jgi:carbamate kinase
MSRTAVIAIGGNSLIPDQSRTAVSYQWDAVRQTCKHIVDLVEEGWQLLVTHGNGPQVGYILRRNELAAEKVHTTPLDLIVADTQGSIGYMLQQAIKNELFSRGIRKPVIAVITQVLVDSDDPAFENPLKPIGGFLTEEGARKFEETGWRVVEDAGRGWRRVVASPKPVRIIEEDVISQLVSNGAIVIAAGGGGIPVVHNHKGELRQLMGVPAVIDKDRASGLLASRVKADMFLISTSVPKVSVEFNTPQQRDLDRVTHDELKGYLEDGQFAPGSMKPKIEAILDFMENGGGQALVTNPSNLASALKGESGTWVEPNKEPLTSVGNDAS